MAKQTASAKPAKSAGKATSNAFIPDDAISSGSASYMKIVKGDNKVRIISRPIAGWVEWVDKKPLRTTLDEQPEKTDDDNPPKKFLAMAVIDQTDGLVKIWEITQQSVIKAIKALAANPDWGNPFSYDININKTGEDLKTKYTVTPSPKKPLSKDAIKAANEKPCNLLALYEGEDPWEVGEEQTEYHLQSK